MEKPKRIDQPKKKLSEQRSKSEQASKLHSSKGSPMPPTPLVEDIVLQSLSADMTFLHNRACHLVDPMEVALPKAMFHYDEDAIAWISKEDVKEFLRGAKLNISLIQTFMRYFNAHIIYTFFKLFKLMVIILHLINYSMFMHAEHYRST